jgi:RNA polymerase sigma-70 factor (ECF subfamily)
VTTATLDRSDEALARLAQGDLNAFADIVREHQSMVFSIAYHFLHDRSLAEEAAQDVFLRLYQNANEPVPQARSRLVTGG